MNSSGAQAYPSRPSQAVLKSAGPCQGAHKVARAVAPVRQADAALPDLTGIQNGGARALRSLRIFFTGDGFKPGDAGEQTAGLRVEHGVPGEFIAARVTLSAKVIELAGEGI